MCGTVSVLTACVILGQCKHFSACDNSFQVRGTVWLDAENDLIEGMKLNPRNKKPLFNEIKLGSLHEIGTKTK